MSIRNCVKCNDPNFDDGACGCGTCYKCGWRESCSSGGWFIEPEIKVTMRSIPHACPVCKGRGEITEEVAQHAAQPKYELANHKIYACHVCVGAGLVWEYNDDAVPAEQPVPNIFTPMISNPPLIFPQFPPMKPEDIKQSDCPGITNPWTNNPNITWTLNPDGTFNIENKE